MAIPAAVDLAQQAGGYDPALAARFAEIKGLDPSAVQYDPSRDMYYGTAVDRGPLAGVANFLKGQAQNFNPKFLGFNINPLAAMGESVAAGQGALQGGTGVAGALAHSLLGGANIATQYVPMAQGGRAAARVGAQAASPYINVARSLGSGVNMPGMLGAIGKAEGGALKNYLAGLVGRRAAPGMAGTSAIKSLFKPAAGDLGRVAGDAFMAAQAGGRSTAQAARLAEQAALRAKNAGTKGSMRAIRSTIKSLSKAEGVGETAAKAATGAKAAKAAAKGGGEVAERIGRVERVLYGPKGRPTGFEVGGKKYGAGLAKAGRIGKRAGGAAIGYEFGRRLPGVREAGLPAASELFAAPGEEAAAAAPEAMNPELLAMQAAGAFGIDGETARQLVGQMNLLKMMGYDEQSAFQQAFQGPMQAAQNALMMQSLSGAINPYVQQVEQARQQQLSALQTLIPQAPKGLQPLLGFMAQNQAGAIGGNAASQALAALTQSPLQFQSAAGDSGIDPAVAAMLQFSQQ